MKLNTRALTNYKGGVQMLYFSAYRKEGKPGLGTLEGYEHTYPSL